ncbi:N,N'-diacetylbacillosaminyl-diphospho-undecaprenol alpha-1,3-N-acetylgalactosaminyltransferase [Thomasclavelia cocleata]|uniref:N,N'-diacetylbacillosaminyl-diphospho-undecaprenol alpha-1,3-N-acetylgalactosaminyltransferase n=1 Tax=Thomasclavelia cocleata TaxID=69824 RepID=A0A829ZAC7_9FIRM|nr:glycosyltransferase family 4 protein [Thomasclavelia cocleata]GFI40939.1 N,N'-diacetylbacillosaminyl-diphospho-undecaprenol alpha-1,3-N-acetylgalactosaminyltransferase [Thomasclavelia cocleata]
MKRILIMANNDVGLYKFRKELILELLKDNEVYISLPYGELVKSLVDMGCKFIDTPVDRRGINPITDLRLLNSYRKIFNQIKPDQVITYTIKPNIYAGMVARFKHVEYAVNITGLGTTFQNENILKKLIIKMYKMALKKVKVVFFENVENRDIFVNEKITSKDKTCLLNGAGVNLEEYPFCKYPEDKEKIRFLFIGRIMKEKGIDELLDAAKRIKQEYKSVEFDIVGPMEDDYKNVINEYVNSDIINYYGFQSDVKPYINKCHCFILPSYHEGMANTLLEAASMGRPLITTNIHGCKEAVDSNGYLVKVKDADDLYMKFKEFIELGYEDKVIMAENSRLRMEREFDKTKVVQETIRKIASDWRE